MKTPFPAVREDPSEINLAPMLDIVFIMLIFFIVTASFIKELGIPVTMPPAPLMPTVEEVESITVIVEPAGVFNVNGRLLSRENLQPYVRALHGENAAAPFAILVTKGSKVGDLAAAADAGRMIGVEVVPIKKLE